MKERAVSALAASTASALGIVCLVWWFTVTPSVNLAERVAGADTTGLPAAAGATTQAVDIKGIFVAFGGVASALPGAWPRFRGAAFDNIAADAPSLATHWTKKGPPVLWSVDLGEGYAGPAVLAGRVYLLDYDEDAKADCLRCFSLDDGREMWRRSYKVHIKRNHGISRTVPAVTDSYVVTIGPKCQVMCVDAATGDFRWGIDLAREFDTEVPLWYTGQCPLIDGSTAIIAPGGSALMIGVDCQTGRIVWKTPNPMGWRMSHSSIMPMTLGGRKMYVYCALGGVVGVAADGDDAGTILWKTSDWAPTVVSPSPVILDNGRVFLTAGYGAGSMMLQVSEENGRFKAEPLFRLDKKVFACEQQTPIFYQGRLFSVLPNDAGAHKRQLACLNPDGTLAWTSGPQHRFGLGPYLIAGDKIFVLRDDGVLTLVEASTNTYVELAQAKVLNGREAWAPMALAGRKLLLRDLKKLVCIDVGAQ